MMQQGTHTHTHFGRYIGDAWGMGSKRKTEEEEGEWEKSDAVKHSAGSVIRLRKSGGPALPSYRFT